MLIILPASQQMLDFVCLFPSDSIESEGLSCVCAALQTARTQLRERAAALTVNSLCPLCVSIERRLYLLLASTIFVIRVRLWSLTSSEEAHNDQYGSRKKTIFSLHWDSLFFCCFGISAMC